MKIKKAEIRYDGSQNKYITLIEIEHQNHTLEEAVKTLNEGIEAITKITRLTKISKKQQTTK